MPPDSTARSAPPRLLLYAAFAAIYVIWGSTYLAIRVGVETLPPFLMAGVRFSLAGGLLFAWLRGRGVAAGGLAQWRGAAIVGTLLLLGGNGLVCWAEQTVSSSRSALLIAVTPLWFALLDWARPGGRRPAGRVWFGIALGFAGVAWLVAAGEKSEPGGGGGPGWGEAALLLACFSWAAGSLVAKHGPEPPSPAMNVAMQMLCGGAGLCLVAALRGEFGRLDPAAVSSRSLVALAYLVVFGSWIAFGAYTWLLRVCAPTRVATYAYVNPVIAVVLGWALLGERITVQVLWAGAVIVAGVVILSLPDWRDPARAGHGARLGKR